MAEARQRSNSSFSGKRVKLNSCKRPEARENASDQVMIGFSFASDWLRGWREFSKPITECSQ